MRDVIGRRPAIWHFRPGTEQPVEVTAFPTGQLVVTCPACQGQMSLDRETHGTSIGSDGALSTTRSFACPWCKTFNAQLCGGVLVQTFPPATSRGDSP